MENNKKKILIVVEAMLGGIRQHVLDIIHGLDKKKYNVYLAYSDNRADDRFFEEYSALEESAVLFRCKYMQRELNLVKDLQAIGELVRIIRRVKPDIVHCHSSKAGIVGRMAARICGIKYIYYTPNAYSFQNPNLGKLKRLVYIEAEKILSRYATTRTINVSRGELQEALKNKLDKRKKFVLIYNGIGEIILQESEMLRRECGFNKEQILIGVTARVTEQKDPVTFMKIAKRIVEQEPRAEFIYIGNGEMEQEIKVWIKNEHLEKKIHMLGFRNDASVLVSMLDIYLSTALYEGLPYSVIEAMRAGVPIIATDVVGNNELVIDGVNGMLFPAGNVEKGAKLIIEQIKTNKIKRENVISVFQHKFSVDSMIGKLERLFEENSLGNGG